MISVTAATTVTVVTTVGGVTIVTTVTGVTVLTDVTVVTTTTSVTVVHNYCDWYDSSLLLLVPATPSNYRNYSLMEYFQHSMNFTTADLFSDLFLFEAADVDSEECPLDACLHCCRHCLIVPWCHPSHQYLETQIPFF